MAEEIEAENDLSKEQNRVESEQNQPLIKPGKDYKASFLMDQAIYRGNKTIVKDRMNTFNSKIITRKTNCSPKFTESALEERKVDAKLTNLKLGKIVEVMKSPRISQLLEMARNVKAKALT